MFAQQGRQENAGRKAFDLQRAPVELRRTLKRLSAHWSAEEIEAYFDRPVFIVSAPRSGSTLLFTLLASTPDIWTIAAESHGVYGLFPHLQAEDDKFTSGRLLRHHADPETCKALRMIYAAMLSDMKGRSFYGEIARNRRKSIIFLEKTPRNALNIDFLLTVFPKARFIFLHRDPKENIASILEGWLTGAQTGQFVTYRNLPGWPLDYWCFILPPGWKTFAGRPLADIAAFQWKACNEILLDDLSKLPADRWISASYFDLISHPQDTLRRLCNFCGVSMGEYLLSRTVENLPVSASTVTAPHQEKWKVHQAEILRVLPNVQPAVSRIASL